MRQPGTRCEEALRFLDSHIEAQDDAGSVDVLRHFEECEACARERHLRSRLSLRLRNAVEREPVDAYIESRIRANLRAHEAGRRRRTWGRALSLATAALAVVVAIGITYELGHLRLTTASQDSYIASISRKVARAFRPGLQDHVHCSVFQKRPSQAPPRDQLAATLGAEYGKLLPVVSARVPARYALYMAHRCGYHGRKYVHLAMMGDGGRLISVVITRKNPGESFAREQLAPVLSETGIPVYQAGVQRFSISGFESDNHLIYVVSDLRPDRNTQFLALLADPLRAVLREIES